VSSHLFFNITGATFTSPINIAASGGLFGATMGSNGNAFVVGTLNKVYRLSAPTFAAMTTVTPVFSGQPFYSLYCRCSGFILASVWCFSLFFASTNLDLIYFPFSFPGTKGQFNGISSVDGTYVIAVGTRGYIFYSSNAGGCDVCHAIFYF
jgi:hypothetical protein